MAEQTVQKFEDQLNCSICLDTYTDPKLLQCFHVYCQKCLVKLVVRDYQGQLAITCPICRQATPVPANGVAGLQPAFQINHFLEIMEEHKKATVDPSASAEKVEPVSTSLTSRDKIKVCCREHDGKEVEFYCETCGEPICYKCAVKGGKHRDHDYEELNKAFQQYKRVITISLEPIEKQLTTINEVLAQIDTRCGEISEQQAAIEADVHSTFQRVQEIFDVRKTEIISQLHQITQEKLNGLAAQRVQMETTQSQLSSCLGFMKESLETGSREELLSMKTMVVKQVKELTATLPPDMLKPNAEADLSFPASTDITALCNQIHLSLPDVQAQPTSLLKKNGGVSESVPEVTHGSDDWLVSEDAGATGGLFSSKKNPVESRDPVGVDDLFAPTPKTPPSNTATSDSKKVSDRKDGQYEISMGGRHKLHVQVEGQHTRGSPFSAIALKQHDTLCEVREPWGVAVNRRGEVVVTEHGANCVSVFSSSGERLRSFGTRGSGEGQLKSPHGVAVDGEGNLLVADCKNNRIQKFTAEGHFLKAVGTKNSGPLQFDRPYGIAFNASNSKVYVTDCSHRIQILNSDLTLSTTFGTHGNGKGQFDHPYDVACDSAGNVYVADYDNYRVQVFTAEGKFLRMFGRGGGGKVELDCPVGIAIDSNDMVYVSEWNNHRVSVFTSEGKFVISFGSFGKKPGQFWGPYGITVVNNGKVYVCDSNNCRIQVYLFSFA